MGGAHGVGMMRLQLRSWLLRRAGGALRRRKLDRRIGMQLCRGE